MFEKKLRVLLYNGSRGTLLVCSMLAFCIALVLTSEAVSEESDHQPAVFKIEPAKSEFARGEDVLVTFTLTNTSKGPLTVNSRFLVNYHFYSEQEVVISLIGPNGLTRPLIPVVDAGVPLANQFETLSPGASTTTSYLLTGNFDINQSGTYRISASYTNRYAQGWIGAIQSSEESFVVEQ